MRRAFSLLEVIIATAILAASAVMLMSMFSTGDRHAVRADERTMAQMLCQSKLDELIADPAQILPIQSEVILQYPGWVWSLEVQETSVPEFVRLTVSITRIPGMETGANLEVATQASAFDASTSNELESSVLASIPKRPTYELSRYIKFDGDITMFETSGFGVGGL